ncbi:MAG: hypothetical protein K6A41_01520 [Bacteroidales bacterium]|nr:hypothetical protein [Bacteroidales bacterium]
MKKIIYYLFVLVALCSFNSCDHNPENSENPVESQVPGGLSGEFSISPTQKIVFSQGNLQYQASTGLWRFADKQYQTIGQNNTQISATYNGWIDLFGWATSGWNNGSKYYKPYEVAMNGCVSCGYDYGPTDGELYNFSLIDDYANSDWGIYNPISNGGNQAGLWRTLSKDEWSYILKERANASELHTLGYIDTIKGLIVLPDNWEQPVSCVGLTDTYTLEQWKDMEEAGAVFLPCGGMRHGYELWQHNNFGDYWTSTGIGGFYPSAYDLTFNFSSFTCSEGGRIDRYYGLSVRLVHVL